MPAAVDKFTNALRDGTIDPYKLNQMSSEERRAVFKKIVGDDNAAKEVNAAFESKTLLKNQKYAYTAWAKKVAGLTPEVRRDMISQIQRLDHILAPDEEKQFLEDLASKRLGFGVTRDEAKNISDLSNKVTETEAKARPDGTFKNKSERLEYGMSKVKLENYVNDLKLSSKNVKTKNPVKLAGKGLKATPGFLTSSLSTLDNSFFGRQGIKTLLNVRTAPTWVKGFVKSFGDIGRELGGKNDALDLIKADIYSRPNAINGNYRRLGKDSGLEALTEEAYPSHAPEKIPLLGRLFKASEAAYNGGALRMRADLADKFISMAEKNGKNVKDAEEMKGIGTLVGSMTGRGSFGRGIASNTAGNWWLFSPKFLKSNVNSLTLHLADKNATAFTRKEAAKNMLGMVTTVGSVLAVAHALNPKSVELDPRSTHFGKINVFGHWTDITGGQGALLTLATRLVPTYSKGHQSSLPGFVPNNFGFFSKSNSGNLTDETSGKYGAQSGLDTLVNFFTGKAAPIPSTAAQILQGRNYSGQTPTFKNIAGNELTPISIQNYSQLADKGNADRFGSLILDGLGFSVTSNPSTNKNNLPQGNKKLVDALNQVNYNVSKPSQQQRGKNLTPAQYKQFVSDRNSKFTQAVQKALDTNQNLDKKRLSTTMSKAQSQALNDLSIKQPKRAKAAKTY
jgi:hypothetical protein